MPEQRILWIALPRGADDSTLELDVLVSPRLGVTTAVGSELKLADFYAVKGLLAGLLDGLGVEWRLVDGGPPFLHPGRAAEILIIPGGGSAKPPTHEAIDEKSHTIHMPNGREVFKRAVVEMAKACRQLLDKSGYAPEDVDLLIPHQANARIMIAVAERLRIPQERAVVDVESVGNTSAASIPVALDRAWRAGRVRTGDLVLLTSFGAGLAWGANLIRWTGPDAP